VARLGSCFGWVRRIVEADRHMRAKGGVQRLRSTMPRPRALLADTLASLSACFRRRPVLLPTRT